MKPRLLFGLALLAFSQAAAQPCQVSGTIKGIGSKPIIFRYEQQGAPHADTVRATNDHFTYTARPSDDGQVILFVGYPYTSFWYEPGRLVVVGQAAQPGQLAVTGTPENDVLHQYKQTIEWKYDQLRKEHPAEKDKASFDEPERVATLRFIGQHPASRSGAFLLYWQTLYHQQYLAQYEQLFQQLAPAVQRSAPGQQAAKRLLVLRNQPVVGRPVADFSVADTAGTKVSLAAYRGHYVLLDFWGHWCGPCMRAMPQLRALHEQYADKLTVIGMAMEDASDAALWKQTIRKNNIPGLQLSELQQDSGPVMTAYNVTAFPTYLLLDRQGALVLRTNDLADIAKKLPTIPDL